MQGGTKWVLLWRKLYTGTFKTLCTLRLHMADSVPSDQVVQIGAY